MNKQNRSLVWMILLFFFCGQMLFAFESESIKRKEIVKTYPMAANGKLAIENKYGNIVISYWDRKEVSVKVVIEAKAGSERVAQEAVDRVHINFQQATNYLSAVTSLENRTWGGNGRGQQLVIHYYVTVPSLLNLDLNQKYGNINLPGDNAGSYRLDVKYGNINAGNFKGGLAVVAQYSNVLLGDVVSASFDLAYCGKVKFMKGQKIEVNSRYSNEELGHVGSLSIQKKYGNGTIEGIDAASIDAKYSNIALGTVRKTLHVDAIDYGTLDIKELDPAFERVQVDARYGNLKIEISSKASFSVRAKSMKYGDFELKGLHVTHSNDGKEEHSAEINGGKGGEVLFDGGGYSNLTIKAK